MLRTHRTSGIISPRRVFVLVSKNIALKCIKQSRQRSVLCEYRPFDGLYSGDLIETAKAGLKSTHKSPTPMAKSFTLKAIHINVTIYSVSLSFQGDDGVMAKWLASSGNMQKDTSSNTKDK